MPTAPTPAVALPTNAAPAITPLADTTTTATPTTADLTTTATANAEINNAVPPPPPVEPPVASPASTSDVPPLTVPAPETEAPTDPLPRHNLDDLLAQLDDGNADTPASAAPGVGDELTDPRDLERPSSASGIVVEVGEGIKFNPTFASFGQRAVGSIVDAIVFLLALVPAAIVLSLGSNTATALLAMAVAALGVVIVVVLGSRALSTNGKWIGNRVTGTTVVDSINGSFIDGGRAGLRMFARHVISPILLFGYLMAFGDSQRRTFHDRLATTVVIRRQRETWSSADGD